LPLLGNSNGAPSKQQGSSLRARDGDNLLLFLADNGRACTIRVTRDGNGAIWDDWKYGCRWQVVNELDEAGVIRLGEAYYAPLE